MVGEIWSADQLAALYCGQNLQVADPHNASYLNGILGQQNASSAYYAQKLQEMNAHSYQAMTNPNFASSTAASLMPAAPSDDPVRWLKQRVAETCWRP